MLCHLPESGASEERLSRRASEGDISGDWMNKTTHREDDLLKHAFKHFKIILYGLRHRDLTILIPIIFFCCYKQGASVGVGVAGYVQGGGYRADGWHFR